MNLCTINMRFGSFLKLCKERFFPYYWNFRIQLLGKCEEMM